MNLLPDHGECGDVVLVVGGEMFVCSFVRSFVSFVSFELRCNEQRLSTSECCQAFLLHSPRKQCRGETVSRYLATFFSDRLRQSRLNR